MHHCSVDAAHWAVAEPLWDATSFPKPPQAAICPRTRLGRLSLALGVCAAIGAAGTLPAQAAAHFPAHAGRHAVAASAKTGRGGRVFPSHVTSAAGRHDRATRVAGAGRSARPGRVGVRVVSAVHRGVVPLANTTWDDPAVPPVVLNAIQAAAQESGVDPHLLAAIAWRESRFDPNARNSQSSAKGLLQFTSGTWLRAVRDFGSEHNVADYAAAIQTSRSGDLVMPEPVRAAILQLRTDPILSAKLAADSMKRERTTLEARLRRPVTSADLYLIHVLGPAGAMRFLEARAKTPHEASTKVASWKVLRNAGLLAQDGLPMTVASTYAAAETMLASQQMHSAPLLATAKDGAPAEMP